MNEEIILQIVGPYIRDSSITYEEFDYLFPMLSKREQYDAVNILALHKIELRVSEEDQDDLFQSSDETIKKPAGGVLPEETIEDDYEDNYTEKDTFEYSNNIKISNLEAEVDDNEEYDYKGKQSGGNTINSPETDDNQRYNNDIFGGNDSGDYNYSQNRKIYQSNGMLVRLYQKGHPQALEDLCIKNRKLVIKYALKYLGFFGNDLSLDDLYFAGMVGFLRAADLFDCSFGSAFSTYAVYWIKQAILREIADYGFTIRIPVHMFEKILKVTKAESEILTQELSLDERAEAISKKLNNDEVFTHKQVMEYIRIREQYMHCTSLDIPIGTDGDSTLEEFIPDDSPENTESLLARLSLKTELENTMMVLNQRERYIINERFGFDGQKQKTLEELGAEMKLTRERVRQIEQRALRKLYKKSKKDNLNAYLEETSKWT